MYQCLPAFSMLQREFELEIILSNDKSLYKNVLKETRYHKFFKIKICTYLYFFLENRYFSPKVVFLMLHPEEKLQNFFSQEQ